MDTSKDLHVSLPSTAYNALAKEAQRRRTNTSRLIRLAVDHYLRELERERIGREMAEYVERMASASGEFVKETNRHVTRRLLEETKW